MAQDRSGVADRLGLKLMRHDLRARVALGRWRSRPRPPEAPDADLIHRGQVLRAATLARFDGVCASFRERALLVTPPSLAGLVWFEDLCRALRHVGVVAHRIGGVTALTPELVAEFQPTLLLALDTDGLQERLLRAQLDRPSRCTRLLIPCRDKPGFGGPLTSAEVNRLQRMSAGAGADVLLSLHAQAFMQRSVGPWLERGRPFLWIAQAACPFRDQPVALNRVFDFVHLSVANPERVRAVWHTLRGILTRGHGLFGERETWGFGVPRQPIDAHARSQMQARVSLAPLVAPLLDCAADLTQRVYAAAASGTFQLTELSPLTRQHFDADELVAVPRGPGLLHEAFERWVDDRSGRERVARRALERIHRDHTSLHRAVQLLKGVKALRA
jgi:hypothetical protein